MNTLNFLDANVWLALIWERHAHATVARSWFERAEGEEFSFCRFVQLTVLRLLTTPAVMGPDVRTMAGAWELWDQILADDRVAFVPEPDGLDARFRHYSRLDSASPKVWADAYLTAFVSVAGLKLVTFDRAFAERPVESLILG
jgi:uncharacterized protein